MAQPEEVQSSRCEITIYPAWCKRCGLCAAFCPAGVFERDAEGRPVVAHPERCAGCRQCELRCPDFALCVSDVRDPERGAP